MTHQPVLVRGASLLGEQTADVLLVDGVIAELGTARVDAPSDARVVEADGLVLLPGLVDLHTHLREPGREDAETVRTGAIVGQLRKHWFSDAEVRLPLLITLAMLVVVVFAYGYFALETTRPGQMADLETRTDSLYFTIQVLTTVGLGDVHAVGQTARAMVALQMVFDLVFVAAGGSLLASVVRTRIDNAQNSLHTPSSETPTEETA